MMAGLVAVEGTVGGGIAMVVVAKSWRGGDDGVSTAPYLVLDCLLTCGGDVQQAHTHNTRGIAIGGVRRAGWAAQREWQWLLVVVMPGSVLLVVGTVTAGGNVDGHVCKVGRWEPGG